MGRADARRARQRGGRRAKPKGGGIRRLFTWRKVLGGFLGAGLLGVGTFIALYLAVDIPSDANALAKAQSNVYTYRDGTLLARTGDVNRESVSLSKVPRAVQHAFVAAENKTFYEDSGVDVKGIARGLLSTLTGRAAQGGSTITQQFVKNYYLSQERTLSRKAQELIISLKVDQAMTKSEILQGYLNTNYYGRRAHGIQAAARAYYDVDAEDLTVEQGAYLAALVQAPSQYDWAVASPTSRRLVLQRWNYVLDNMVDMHWLDAGKRAAMTFPKPVAPKPAPGMDGQVGYLVEAAKKELIASGVSEQELEAGGWNITLGIDRKKQKALERAVDTELMADLDPDRRTVDADVQVGAVSVDPATGRIVAMYGGEDYVKHFVGNATRRDYQAASTFKPVVFAAALENGSRTQDGVPITANTVYDGTSGRPVQGSTTPFAPPNEDDHDYGPITVQKAMSNSVNSVFAQMGVDVGLEEVKRTAVDLGMDGQAGGFVLRPSMSLGVMGASPLDMAGVYATVDNHGKKVTPRLVTSVERGEEQVELKDPIGGQVISRTTADTVTSVLTGVVDDGTGAAAQSAGLEIAGKTGTSDDNKSAWFTGYTPDLVTSVGLFGEDTSGKRARQVTLRGAGGGGRLNGGDYPAEIWAAYTRAALKGKAPAEFDLETDQGPAVVPTPTQAPATPSDTADPDPTPTPTDQPSSPDPTPTTSAPDPTPTTSTPVPPTSSPPPTTPLPPQQDAAEETQG